MSLGILAAAVLPGPLLPALLIMAGAGLVGGMIGKARMIRENAEGKVMTPPSTFNKEAAIGMASGWILGGLAATIIAGVAGIPLLMASGDALSTISLIANATPPIVLAGQAIGAVVGGIAGGNRGKKRMAAEYDMALDQEAVARRHERSLAPAQEIEAPAAGKSFVQQLASERAQSQRSR